VFLCGFVFQANAAPYGNFIGETVNFMNVQDADGLYGAPTHLGGDEIYFFPLNFKAESENGGSQNTSDLLQMMLVATGENLIERVRIQEFGNYTMSGSVASATVHGSLTTTVLGGPGGSIIDDFVYNYALPGDSSGVYNGFVEIELPSPAAMVQLTFDNTLTAESGSGSTSEIQKQVGDAAITLTVNPDPVPIPSAILLLLSGLAGGGLWRFKKKSSL
jgi:hypothetical protein